MSEDTCDRCGCTESRKWFRKNPKVNSPWSKLCGDCHGQIRLALTTIHAGLLELDEEGLKEVAKMIDERRSQSLSPMKEDPA